MAGVPALTKPPSKLAALPDVVKKRRDAISRQVMQADRNLPFGEIFGRAARDLLYGAKPANKSGSERDELRNKNSSIFGKLLTR